MRLLGIAGHNPGTARRLLTLLAVCLPLVMVTVSLAEAAPPGQSPQEGQAIFQQKCAACHTVGGGDLVGPDLKGVTTEREQDWLIRWIVSPDKMLAEKDPIATKLLQQYNNVPMPNLGVSEADARQILAFLGAEEGGVVAKTEHKATSGAPAPAAARGAPPTGDPLAGRALFTGVARFQNVTPGCISCHTVTGIGALGGGTMGPDLTRAINKYGGETGLASVLATPPFPTMKPIFGNHPLTPEEQANLIAFLKTTANQQPASTNGRLILIAFVVFAVLIGIAQLVWRGRLGGVRRPMVKQGKA